MKKQITQEFYNLMWDREKHNHDLGGGQIK
jgi:hypothetical protein